MNMRREQSSPLIHDSTVSMRQSGHLHSFPHAHVLEQGVYTWEVVIGYGRQRKTHRWKLGLAPGEFPWSAGDVIVYRNCLYQVATVGRDNVHVQPVAVSSQQLPAEETTFVTVRGIALQEGYEAWCVTIEHPQKEDAAHLCLDGSELPQSVKRAQWELGYRHGGFPIFLRPDMLVRFRDQCYTLLSVGSNSLCVQALAPETFHADSARVSTETAVFQVTPEREERLQRHCDIRQRPKRGWRERRTVDDPQFQKEIGPRSCYELSVAALPCTLRDDLPTWARGGDQESPTSMVRNCYIQFFTLDQHSKLLRTWDQHGAQQEGADQPTHARVTLEMSDLSSVPVFALTGEEASHLVEQMLLPDTPAPVIFVAPASFLENELRTMIAPGISLPSSFYQSPAPTHHRVSLERGQQVAIPRKIAMLRTATLGLSLDTDTCLRNAAITTLGEFLELEEEVLVEAFPPSCLWEMYGVLSELHAFPTLAQTAPPHAPEDAETVERDLTRLPQFEVAFRRRVHVYCQFGDGSVQEVTCVRARKGVLQALRASDGVWTAPTRFWTPVRRSARSSHARRVAPTTPAGYVPTDTDGRPEIGTPISEEFYYQLTGTTYDDPQRGLLYLARATALVDRLHGRQSGSVQTVWLTHKQVEQSLQWERRMKSLDHLELRVQVHEYAQHQGAYLPEVLLPEEVAFLRKEEQVLFEERYNRVPVAAPTSTKDHPHPLELFVSREDVHEAFSMSESPSEALRTIIKHYIHFPEALPPGDRLPRHVLVDLCESIKEDRKHTRKLNRMWHDAFPGDPHPHTMSYVRAPAYRYQTTYVWDRRRKQRVPVETREHIGYRFIIGVLPTAAPPGSVLTPRPVQQPPQPRVARTPDCVPRNALAKERSARRAIA